MEQESTHNLPLISHHVPNYGAVLDPKIGISTDTLVSNTLLSKPSKLPQYGAAISVTLGAFALGNVLSWTSPTSDELKGVLGEENWSWIGALMALGAMAVVLPIGYSIDRIGRKTTMMLLVLPFTAGWFLIAWGEDRVAMYMVGRFLTGMMGGAFSLTAPVYTGEIAQTEIRGTLGSYFQLMVTIGILFVYGVGSVVSAFVISLICGIVPLVFGAIFFFMPETPLYYLQKGELEKARASLQFFRGKNYGNLYIYIYTPQHDRPRRPWPTSWLLASHPHVLITDLNHPARIGVRFGQHVRSPSHYSWSSQPGAKLPKFLTML
ncbi:hypothetical protein L9F63_019498, partial [Diploptera punctata]